METLFLLASLLVAPFWLLMIVVPRWAWTDRLVRGPWIAAPPAVLYAFLVLPRAPELLASFQSAASVAAILGSVDGTTIAWLHFLAFDLFVGRWIYLDGRNSGTHPLLLSVVLLLTFLFGPLGFLLYGLLLFAPRGVKASRHMLLAQS